MPPCRSWTPCRWHQSRPVEGKCRGERVRRRKFVCLGLMVRKKIRGVEGEITAGAGAGGGEGSGGAKRGLVVRPTLRAASISILRYLSLSMASSTADCRAVREGWGVSAVASHVDQGCAVGWGAARCQLTRTTRPSLSSAFKPRTMSPWRATASCVLATASSSAAVGSTTPSAAMVASWSESRCMGVQRMR